MLLISSLFFGRESFEILDALYVHALRISNRYLELSFSLSCLSSIIFNFKFSDLIFDKVKNSYTWGSLLYVPFSQKSSDKSLISLSFAFILDAKVKASFLEANFRAFRYRTIQPTKTSRADIAVGTTQSPSIKLFPLLHQYKTISLSHRKEIQYQLSNTYEAQ